MRVFLKNFIWFAILISLVSFLIHKNLKSSSEKFRINTVDQLFVSPNREKVGFVIFEDIFDEEIPEDRQVLIYVGDRKENKFREVYYGSFRTSGWEWFSDDEILVPSSCGTECQVIYLIDVNTGEKNELQYGVDYTWSSNKEYVFAYNYTWRYGLTVGDKQKNILLTLERDSNSDTVDSWDLIVQTQAVWSLDSTKLAVVIKKEGQQKMELLVFENKIGKFEQVYQKDIGGYSENDRLVWNGKGLWYGKLRL